MNRIITPLPKNLCDFFFLQTRSLINPGAHQFWLDWLVAVSPGIFLSFWWPSVISTGVTDVDCRCTWFLCEYWGSEVRSFCLCSKHLPLNSLHSLSLYSFKASFCSAVPRTTILPSKAAAAVIAMKCYQSGFHILCSRLCVGRLTCELS